MVFLSGFVDGDLRALRVEQVKGGAPFDSWNHEIFNSDVSESSAGHDLVVSSTSAVAVKVFHRNGVLDEVGPCRGGLLDVACGGDVVGGDGVAENT